MERKILIIDDSEEDREIMKRFLLKAGYKNLLFASDGEKGIEVARKEKPDLIIMDIVMPRQDGPKVADMLQSDRITTKIPIIFVTSLIRSGESQGGTSRVFAKPFDSKELIHKIEDLMGEVGK